MARPAIVQGEGQIGFYWSAAGRPVTLAELVRTDDEPERLLPTHLEALDDALIIAAGRFGELLGGGRRPTGPERSGLADLHRAVDRSIHEYAVAAEELGTPIETRAGQIVGTAALVSVLAREPIGLLGPAPLDGTLDPPSAGVVGGFGELATVAPDRPWLGGRWTVRTVDGRRLPATLSMLLFDSSGVYKDAALDEHRALLRATAEAAASPEADPLGAACAIDWLLYDWLRAHQDGPDSAAIELKGGAADAELVVRAAAASIRARALFDPGLLRLAAAVHPWPSPAG
ncbi:hypothetical protein [Cryptosporangium sp. NPDC051539]|uniref:hypothetical protein n=1 Tax=Cryptosporangium sp. NPDC051539 TaxID=3363962 RepID=UPI0037883268